MSQGKATSIACQGGATLTWPLLMWIKPHRGARWGVLWEEGAHIAWALLKSKRTSSFRKLS